MARTYKRDSRGRFAGGGGSSSRGGGRKPLQRGTNRLTRDNAGRITSVGGDGATARGGRLRTASGKQRATVTAKGIGKAPAGTVSRSGRVKAPARVKAQKQAAAKPAATAKPARRRAAIGKISEAKANRIVARIDANRPGRRAASGSARRTQNAIKTHRKASDFALAAAARARRSGKEVTVAQSLQRAVSNAAKQSRRQKQAAAKPAATAKPASKLGFTQSDFARRSQRTASIRNPQVKAKAQQLYGKILDLNSTPRQLKSMFKKAGKPKQRTATAATRQMRREHQNMMAASKVLFK